MNGLTGFSPKNILCPVDFSDLSGLALKYAATGALLYRARLILMHAELIELPRYFSRSENEQLKLGLESAKEMIQKELAGYVTKTIGREAERIAIEYVIMDANPVEAVLQTADKRNVDLIVIGTHGLSGIKRMLLGSVTENIIREAKVPVFTVRQNEHEFIEITDTDAMPRIERILCACGLNEADRETLNKAVSLAEGFNARLTVLYSDESQKIDDLSRDREKLCSWISGAVKTQCELEPIVRMGSAADQIITQAKEGKSDLIVIGARHRLFHDAMILGRTTELVVRHAPAPVLIIPGLSE